MQVQTSPSTDQTTEQSTTWLGSLGQPVYLEESQGESVQGQID
jgi:hypothetical protein